MRTTAHPGSPLVHAHSGRMRPSADTVGVEAPDPADDPHDRSCPPHR